MTLRRIQTCSLPRMGIPCIVPLLKFGIAALLAAGLPAGLAAQSFAAHLYGQDDGLANQAIVDLAQDAAGHLWVGTENGLVRYDGARFIAYGREHGLKDPRTYNIHIDHLGTIWVANRAGLFYFDGDRFHEVQIRGHAILAGINSKLASSSRGELLVASANEGFLSVERDSASAEWKALSYADRHPSFPLYSTVHGVTVDRHDRLWFGCGTSICGFSPSDRETPGMRRQPVAPLDGVPQGEYDAFLVQEGEQQNGRLWARGSRFIVTCLLGERQVRDVSAPLPGSKTGLQAGSQTGFQDTIYRDLIEDRLGNVLTPTTDGFATWDGSRWEETASTTQGPIDGATALLADREGGIWIGTAGKGLLQALGYKHWVSYTLAQGLKSQLIFGVAIDNRRRLWLGSPRGIDILPPVPHGRSPHPGPMNRMPVGSNTSCQLQMAGCGQRPCTGIFTTSTATIASTGVLSFPPTRSAFAWIRRAPCGLHPSPVCFISIARSQ